MNKEKRNCAILVLTALIWGVAFVAQSEGGDAIGPYTFSSIRFLIGAVVLLPVIRLLDHYHLTGRKPASKEEWKMLIKAGMLCGIFLSGTSIFQQLGLYYGTPSGKAGFLTACYIILVPVLGLFLKKKCGWNVWMAVAITVVGLYFLCMNNNGQEGLGFQTSDILVLVCSVMCSFHILVVGHYSEKVDPVRMSCIQFLTAFVIAAVPMFFGDMQNGREITRWLTSFASWKAWIPLLYAGVLSSGVAYTLQIVGQQGVNPTIASLLMSLESVFSVLAGWIILGEKLGGREILGCVFIFAAIILAQVSFPAGKRN